MVSCIFLAQYVFYKSMSVYIFGLTMGYVTLVTLNAVFAVAMLNP